MEGKNCFRTRWLQTPLYSGGNVASLILSLSGPQRSTDHGSVECLVMACGDVVNVLLATTGELLASYKLPVEDVILRIDAVSIVAPVGCASVAGRKAGDNNKKRKGDATVNIMKDENRENVTTSAFAGTSDDVVKVPIGSYIAVGTRSLQIYVLRFGHSSDSVGARADAAQGDDKGQCETGRGSEVVADGWDEKGAPFGLSCTLAPLRSWTAAQQAISVVQFTSDASHLISGSTDGAVKVWDVFNHHLTHNLRVPSASLVHSVYVDAAKKFLCVGDFEGHATVFDFVSRRLITHGRLHVAAVEALCLTADGKHLFTVGRDRKVVICDISTPELNEQRSIVVKEHISSAVFESGTILHVGAMDGTVSTYSASVTESLRLMRRLRRLPASHAGGGDSAGDELSVRSLLVAHKPKGMQEANPLHDVLYDDNPSQLYVADASFNITLLVPHPEKATYTCHGTLVGFLDQILDLKLFPRAAPFHHIVVTNSNEPRCFKSGGCLSTQSLLGHTDIVLACDISSDASLIATAGKDGDVRFWSTETWSTIAIGTGGHAMDITAIAFNGKQTKSYMLLFSVGADENLRLWDVGVNVCPALSASGELLSEKPPRTFSYRSGVNNVHEGLIHALAVAPNDQYVATAGKDKNVNLWTVSGKKIYRDSSLKGHRRAISALAFSPVDRVLASASNDGSVRLWSLTALVCVKTLQFDSSPVLQLAFFNGGTQMVTGNAEGILRVWAIATAEVVWSGETHEDKIWGLCVSDDEHDGTVFFSGSADGVLVATEDYTAEEAVRLRNERHDVILKEQQLANALRRGNYEDAFMVALKLNHPRNLRQVVAKWSTAEPQDCEEVLREKVLPSLDEEQLVRLLQFTREWVTNARYCNIASLVIHCVLAAFHFSQLMEMPAIRSVLEALLAYMQRHSRRIRDVLRRTYYIDYVTRSTGPPTLTVEPPFFSNTICAHEPPRKVQRLEAS
ncbi:WD domain [Trypanosoma vivax]|uniref:Utp13 specific WD40 domain protein n=1 Tax=Trypanosoma vivax (strain Y486) TaxID=1055687 RepID=G0U9R6_TRYVY|nr:Utp13 specific WD40 domain protein [Trypanosoma vivax]KAH8619020.1 WD domain [Trypanosoma vivax]CCC52547.1 Utp13 specific WD40 domain protein [Trypanosoma vivax Y486]